jgi:enoyl-CoA hydratase
MLADRPVLVAVRHWRRPELPLESTPILDVAADGPILHLTLNRPAALNAITPELTDHLIHALEQAAHSDARAIVLSGAGRAFSAGGDHKTLNAWSGEHAAGFGEGRADVARLIRAFISLEKPVVAAVRGVAIGMGAMIVLHCDYIVIAEDAKIGDRHVSLGLVPGDEAAIWTALLGPRLAKEMLFTGRLLSGTEAAAIGLVNKVTSAEEVMSAAVAYATELAALPPYALAKTKASVNRYLQSVTDLIFPASFAWEEMSMLTADHREAMAAFKEKRQGTFSGR